MRNRWERLELRQSLAFVLIWLVGTITGQMARAGDDPADGETTARKAEREENMRAMLKRAQATTVTVVDKEKRSDALLISKPLFHYSDQPRQIVDATLWGWTRGGRLVSVCKIEKYDFPAERMWLYCFGSLSTGLVDVTWADGRPWSSTKPGLEFQPVTDAPPPAKDVATRLRQMKDMSNRFEARILVDNIRNDTQQMRLLPRPLLRYENPIAPILDGAAFGLTTNGTNPDAVLVVELHGSDPSSAKWMFGVAGMTAGGVTVKLDNKVVWTKPFVGNVGRYETWLWFHGKPDVGNTEPGTTTR